MILCCTDLIVVYDCAQDYAFSWVRLCCCGCGGGLVLCLRCGMAFAWHVCLLGLLGFLVFWYAGFSVCWGFGCVYWLVVLGGCFLVGFGWGGG